MRFENKIALITAAANGIGRATAEIMVAEGATVICIDNHPQRLAAAIAALGDRAHARLCDALDQTQVDAVVADTVKHFSRIDILVNAVGGSTIIARPSANVEEHSLAVVPVMKQQRSGKIINLASIAGRGVSVASGSAYAAAKGGIIAFTRKLSFELGPFGININAIAPSLTLTERIRPHWNQRSPQAQTAQLEATPLRRVAEASDQAKVICFLASSDADFVTGLTIDVTGGQSG